MVQGWRRHRYCVEGAEGAEGAEDAKDAECAEGAEVAKVAEGTEGAEGGVTRLLYLGLYLELQHFTLLRPLLLRLQMWCRCAGGRMKNIVDRVCVYNALR